MTRCAACSAWSWAERTTSSGPTTINRIAATSRTPSNQAWRVMECIGRGGTPARTPMPARCRRGRAGHAA